MSGFVMRAPCADCGSAFGSVTERNGQDTVRCAECYKYQYNAPRVETGREQRSVSTTHAAIKPKQRARIIDRAHGRCESCGRKEGVLHVGHWLSVDSAMSLGLSEAEINDDENLYIACEECNLGQGAQPVSLTTMVAVIRARISWRNKYER